MTNKEINLQRVLVVCPLNTVLNWQVEFDKWLSVDDRLEVRYQHFKAQECFSLWVTCDRHKLFLMSYFGTCCPFAIGVCTARCVW